METSHLIICGGLRIQRGDVEPDKVLRLDLWQMDATKGNVELHIEDIHKRLLSNVPDQFADLLEIATYVYSADQAIRRGALDVPKFGANWRRNIHLHVPVRCPDFWNQPAVQSALTGLLDFLSDDFYSFTFHGTTKAPQIQGYLGLADSVAPKAKPEQVTLFSGGLDSLAGAIEEVVIQKRQVILVNHRSTHKLGSIHRELKNLLDKHSGELKPIHMTVRINKDQHLTKDYTQRSRSFLYAAIGATIAEMVGLRSICFYENGVVGLNLPVCAQVVGGRATRTAHPRVLSGFRNLLSLVAGAPFEVKNPFVWHTRGEIIKKIIAAGCGDTIAMSISCAHTWEMSNDRTHCGLCSQCIDRRIGIIAAGVEALDPITQYRSDVFLTSLSKDEDKMMAATYLERANSFKLIRNELDLVKAYPAVLDAIPHLDGNAAQATAKILDLYRRHANEVNQAIDIMLAKHAAEIRKRSLPGDCLLRVVCESNAVTSVPTELINSPVVDSPAACKIIGDFNIIRFSGGIEVNLSKRAKPRSFLRYVEQWCKEKRDKVFLYEEVLHDYNTKHPSRQIRSDRMDHDLFKSVKGFDLLFETLDRAAQRFRLLI